MTAVPRDANGDFLSPQFRFESVRPNQLRRGDQVSWAVGGVGIIATVADAWDGTGDSTGLILVDQRGLPVFFDQVPADRLIHRVEVLW